MDIKSIEHNGRKGTVMMEFIIAFPIYLVLFAMVMSIGDMLIHSIRLPSAERTWAFDFGGLSASGQGYAKSTMFHPGVEIADDGTDQDDLTLEENCVYYSDADVEGPWSLQTAVKVRDGYKLPAGGTAGQLLFLDWFFSDITKQDRATGDYADLINGRSIGMRSKDVDNTRLYNYYTMRRARYEAMGWRDNRQDPSRLLCDFGYGRQPWMKKVLKEGYSESTSDTAREGKAPPGDIGATAQYTRFETFVTWSN